MVPLKCFRKFTLAFVFLLGGAAPLTSIAADPAPTPEAASAPDAAAPTTSEILTQKRVPVSGNPGAVNFSTGDGFLQSLTPIKPDSGVTLGGIWLSDYNVLISGGAEPGASSWNSLLILSLMVDAEKLVNWQGAEFGIQFLQFNGENTNGQAGSVQGYNGLPGAPPLDRSELYQLWYLQKFGDLLAVRIGRTVPTYDFNNVTRPAPTQDPTLQIPAVSGLIFTPIFVNPTMLGALPGYYNSANGLTVNFTPFKNIYFNYGFYDGNLANGVQTGMVGPQFNGYYFNIWEAGMDWMIGDSHPGQFGAGVWYQTGVLDGPGDLQEDGTGGFYLFGGQRVWGRKADSGALTSKDGKSVISHSGQDASVSVFYQFGVNNSETLPVNQYFGAGVTGFGLVPLRPSDSVGFGMAWSWLNPELFDRSSELMFQSYYQAHIYAGAFIQPTVSYIPTPGASSSLGGAWALTMRFTLLF